MLGLTMLEMFHCLRKFSLDLQLVKPNSGHCIVVMVFSICQYVNLFPNVRSVNFLLAGAYVIFVKNS